jgi:hypothetical protein
MCRAPLAVAYAANTWRTRAAARSDQGGAARRVVLGESWAACICPALRSFSALVAFVAGGNPGVLSCEGVVMRDAATALGLDGSFWGRELARPVPPDA